MVITLKYIGQNNTHFLLLLGNVFPTRKKQKKIFSFCTYTLQFSNTLLKPNKKIIFFFNLSKYPTKFKYLICTAKYILSLNFNLI